eukprot:6717956-Prymnesium_polylepis.1
MVSHRVADERMLSPAAPHKACSLAASNPSSPLPSFGDAHPLLPRSRQYTRLNSAASRCRVDTNERAYSSRLCRWQHIQAASPRNARDFDEQQQLEGLRRPMTATTRKVRVVVRQPRHLRRLPVRVRDGSSQRLTT